jgi:hypothetical protein
MVTHNWSNKFVHLVAAVLADIFGATCYHDLVAELSDSDYLNMLREKLRREKALDRAY